MDGLANGPVSFLDACLFQFELSFFEVSGRQHAVVRVLAFRVVEHLDVVECVLSCVVARWVCAPPDPRCVRAGRADHPSVSGSHKPCRCRLRPAGSVRSGAHTPAQGGLTDSLPKRRSR